MLRFAQLAQVLASVFRPVGFLIRDLAPWLIRAVIGWLANRTTPCRTCPFQPPGAATAQIRHHARTARAAQEELQQRLEATDSALAARLDLLKDYVREFALSKADLKRYEAAVDRRLMHIEARLEEMAG